MLCAFNDQINDNFKYQKNVLDHRRKGVDQCAFLSDNRI
ncbi:MAG: hypothetical protein JWP78_2949 [Mucilaginibacter sp.]|nr:hypothetical protein [Mucilaginibacter sp.]